MVRMEVSGGVVGTGLPPGLVGPQQGVAPTVTVEQAARALSEMDQWSPSGLDPPGPAPSSWDMLVMPGLTVLMWPVTAPSGEGGARDTPFVRGALSPYYLA